MRNAKLYVMCHNLPVVGFKIFCRYLVCSSSPEFIVLNASRGSSVPLWPVLPTSRRAVYHDLRGEQADLGVVEDIDASVFAQLRLARDRQRAMVHLSKFSGGPSGLMAREPFLQITCA